MKRLSSNHSVAVIVSTYNARDTLARVLAGYMNQTRLPDEIIVADDGSSDGTGELISELAVNSSFPIKHIRQEDQGFRLARIRNLAIKACISDYVIFTDGDCIPHPKFVEDHARLIHAGYFIQGKRMMVSESASPTFAFTNSLALFAQCVHGELSGAHHLIRIPNLARPKHGLRGIKTANFAVFRRDFVAVNGFNEDFVTWGREDSELVVRLYKYGMKRKDAPFSALVFHLWHRESDKGTLPKNDQLLQQTMDNPGYRCAHRIENEDTSQPLSTTSS